MAQMAKNLPAMWETWVRKFSWRRAWQPTLVFLPGNPMDRGAWQLLSKESKKVGHNKAQYNSPSQYIANILFMDLILFRELSVPSLSSKLVFLPFYSRCHVFHSFFFFCFMYLTFPVNFYKLIFYFKLIFIVVQLFYHSIVLMINSFILLGNIN